MNEQRKKSPGRKVLSWIALILLAGSAYCWYRAKVVHDQSPLNIEIPIHLADGSAQTITFAIPWKRPCETAIQYPKSTSVDVVKALHALAGEVVLTSNGTDVAKATMPTHTISAAGSVIGTILFRFQAERDRCYLISVKVNYVPTELQNLQGTLKIQDDFFHYKDVIGLTILSEVLGVVAILIIIPVIYSWLRNRQRPA